jgi:hypothetical protein
MGAGQEAELISVLRAEEPRGAHHLDERDPASLGEVAVPRVSEVVREVWRGATEIVRGLDRSPMDAIREHRAWWLARAATRLGRYAFARAWGRALPGSVARVVFLAPSTVTFAIADALAGSGTRAEWWQHGMIRRSSLYARVPRARLLTVAEADYLRILGVCPQVELYFPKAGPATPLDPRSVVLLASQHDTDTCKRAAYLDRLREVVDWLAARGHRLVVRPHPREDLAFWSAHFPNLEIQREPVRFLDHLRALRPRFVLSWFSTALIDGSLVGVPGLTLGTGPDAQLEDVVFDFEATFLQWGRDQARIEAMLKSERERSAYRDRLVRVLFGCGGEGGP